MSSGLRYLKAWLDQGYGERSVRIAPASIVLPDRDLSRGVEKHGFVASAMCGSGAYVHGHLYESMIDALYSLNSALVGANRQLELSEDPSTRADAELELNGEDDG